MSLLRGSYRLFIITVVLMTGTLLILSTVWIPFRFKGVRISPWIATFMARLFMVIFRIEFHCPEPEKVRRLHGFLLPNHTTYLDIIMVVYLLPMRFVAKAEIRGYPLIGLIARAIDCVFVERHNKASRAKAREALAKVERYPPILLFPEGKTGSGDTLLPFRHGAFEIASQNSIPFLPCVIVYDRPEIVRWMGDPFTRAIWRLACRPGTIHAQLIPLEVVETTPADDPAQLAEETHRRMTAVLDSLNSH